MSGHETQLGKSLNPCLNGRGVVRVSEQAYGVLSKDCLNPCLNGRGVVRAIAVSEKAFEVLS